MADPSTESDDLDLPDGDTLSEDAVDADNEIEAIDDPIVDPQIDAAIRRAEAGDDPEENVESSSAETPNQFETETTSDLDTSAVDTPPALHPDEDLEPVTGDADETDLPDLTIASTPVDEAGADADALDQAIERTLTEAGAEALDFDQEPDGDPVEESDGDIQNVVDVEAQAGVDLESEADMSLAPDIDGDGADAEASIAEDFTDALASEALKDEAETTADPQSVIESEVEPEVDSEIESEIETPAETGPATVEAEFADPSEIVPAAPDDEPNPEDFASPEQALTPTEDTQDIDHALDEIEGLASDLEEALDPNLEAQLDDLVAQATSTETAEPRPDPEPGAEASAGMDIQELDALLAEEAAGIEGDFETVGDVVPELAAQIDAALDNSSAADGASAEDLARELDAETAEIAALAEAQEVASAAPPPSVEPASIGSGAAEVPELVQETSAPEAASVTVASGLIGKLGRLTKSSPQTSARALRTTLAVVNTPARRLSPELRDTVGWAVLVVTGFNVAFALYGLLLG